MKSRTCRGSQVGQDSREDIVAEEDLVETEGDLVSRAMGDQESFQTEQTPVRVILELDL